METEKLLKTLSGNKTLEMIKTSLNTDTKKAVYLIHRLRKKGYVKTKKLSNNKRLYNISIENKLGGISYVDIINSISPMKIWGIDDHRIYGRKPSVEETLIYAIKTKDIRTILASLALYKQISNWPLLYRLAKKEDLQRQVGALYDVARTIIKTRKMTKRFRNLSLPKKSDKFKFILQGFKSKDFQIIEKTWKVYIPLNIADLEDYNDWNRKTK